MSTRNQDGKCQDNRIGFLLPQDYSFNMTDNLLFNLNPDGRIICMTSSCHCIFKCDQTGKKISVAGDKCYWCTNCVFKITIPAIIKKTKYKSVEKSNMASAA